MSDTYYQKYLKYKNKYLELKNRLESNQTGGMARFSTDKDEEQYKKFLDAQKDSQAKFDEVLEGNMSLGSRTGKEFVDPNPRSDFTTLPIDKIPKENMNTQMESAPYNTVCASQNPILCGNDSKNAGYCVKTNTHCDADDFLRLTHKSTNYMLNKEDYKASYNPKLYKASDFTKGQVTEFASGLLKSVSKFIPMSPAGAGKKVKSSSPTTVSALQKEIDDLKAKNAELQKSSDESNKKKQEILDIVGRLINYFGFKVRTAQNNNLLFSR